MNNPTISSSLEIVEYSPRLNLSSFESYDVNFSYSKDESSLSFQIEGDLTFESGAPITVPDISASSLASPTNPSRLCRGIFDKYRTPPPLVI
jgi:hypothetical protein